VYWDEGVKWFRFMLFCTARPPELGDIPYVSMSILFLVDADYYTNYFDDEALEYWFWAS